MIYNVFSLQTEIMTFISADRSIQQISLSIDVRSIALLPIRTMNFVFNDSSTAVPTPENMSLRFAEDVPIGSPDLSSSSRELMSLKYVVRLYAVKSDP